MNEHVYPYLRIPFADETSDRIIILHSARIYRHQNHRRNALVRIFGRLRTAWV